MKEPVISFFVKGRGTYKPIYLTLRVKDYEGNYNRIRYSTGLKCIASDLKAAGNVKGDIPTTAEIQKVQLHLREKLKEYIIDHKEHPPRETVIEWLDAHYGKETPNDIKPFVDDFKDFIESASTESTGRARQGSRNRFADFLIIKNGKEPIMPISPEAKKKLEKARHDELSKFRYDDITIAFLDDFFREMRKTMNPRSAKLFLRHFKAFVNRGYDLEKHNNTAHQRYKPDNFDSVGEIPVIKKAPILTEKEIQEIIDIDVSNNKKMQETKALLLILLGTGSRFDDLDKCIPENAEYNKKEECSILKFLPGKTEKHLDEVQIPVHPMVATIWHQYPEGLNIPLYRTMRARMEKLLAMSPLLAKDKRYKAITLHSFRRTFLTKLYNMDISPTKLMRISGHKDFKIFLEYIGEKPRGGFKEIIEAANSFLPNMKIAK